MTVTDAPAPAAATGDSPAPPRGRRRELIGYWLLLPGALWLVVFFVIPFYSLVATSLYDPDGSVLQGYEMTWAFGNYVDALQDYWRPLLRSLWYGGVATVICLVLGYVLAYAIAFKSGRWKNLMLVLVIAPFFTSFLVRTLSWKLLLARRRLHRRHPSVPAPDGRGRPAAGHAGRRHRRPGLQLPAVHGAAALRQHRQDRPSADRGGGRPLLPADRRVLQGDLAAVAAGRRRRAPC